MDVEFSPTYVAPESQAETVRLAVESARRWANRTDLDPITRTRRIYTVLAAALNEEAK